MNKDKPINANTPAFGCIAMTDTNGYHGSGLSKREYFAGLAMQGILANHDMIAGGDEKTIHWTAVKSVLFADELLKQLEQ